ncbi:MAG: hypothetical protein KF753_22885 [Caldilineaceae bacterium]|nr:hypothetical protein [Caldilineaceae bacterium]
MSTDATRTRKCTHPDPDLLHLRDEQKADDIFVRVFDCAVCGRYEIPLDIYGLDKFSRLQLQFLGQLISIGEDKVAEVRARRYAELRSRTSGE